MISIFLCFVFVFAVHKMGYDIARFQGEVDEELICPICSGVLEEPLHVSDSAVIY